MTEDQREISDDQPDRAAAIEHRGLASLLGALPTGTLDPFVIFPAVEFEETRPEAAADSMAMADRGLPRSSPSESIVDQPPRPAEMASQRDALRMARGAMMTSSQQPFLPGPGSSPPGNEVLHPFLARSPDVHPSEDRIKGQFDPSALLLDVSAGRTERAGLPTSRAGHSVVPGIIEDPSGLMSTALDLSSSASIVERAMPPEQAWGPSPGSTPAHYADELDEFDSARSSRFATSPIVSATDLLGPASSPVDGPRELGPAAASEPASSIREASPWGERGPSTRFPVPSSLDLGATGPVGNSGSIDEISGVAARLLDVAARIEQAAERFSMQRPQAYASTPPPFRGRVDG